MEQCFPTIGGPIRHKRRYCVANTRRNGPTDLRDGAPRLDCVERLIQRLFFRDSAHGSRLGKSSFG